jgi:type IV secretion system protein VirB8
MKTSSTQQRKIIEKSVDFEVSLTQKAKESEKRAWIIAVISAVLVLILIISIIIIMPLKEKTPYLVMTDAYTGSATLTKITGDFGVEEITRNEVVNKSNIARFIIARESYDWDLIARRDWNTVHSMGVVSVTAPYADQFQEINPKNPDKIYGREKSIRVRIKTIVLTNPADNSRGFTGATVRFDKLIINKRDDRVDSAESFIATIAFEYSSNLLMAEQFRIENPLGFRVLSYRVDPELTSSKTAILNEINAEALGITPDRTR